MPGGILQYLKTKNVAQKMGEMTVCISEEVNIYGQ